MGKIIVNTYEHVSLPAKITLSVTEEQLRDYGLTAPYWAEIQFRQEGLNINDFKLVKHEVIDDEKKKDYME